MTSRCSIWLSLPILVAACGGRTSDPADGTGSLVVPPGTSQTSSGAAGPERPRGPEAVASDVGTPSALVLDGDRVVFTTRATVMGGERVQAGALFVADKRVPPALMIAVDNEGNTYDALATDGASAFVATSDARVLAVSLSGGAPLVVAQLDAPAVALATSGNYVYYALSSGLLGRAAKSGGAPETLATAPGAVRGLVADDAAVYVATASSDGTGGVVRVALASLEARSIATAPGAPCAIVRDAAQLFWTTAEAPAKGSVLRVSVEGGDVATVASGAFAACALAADASSLYFATRVAPVKATSPSASLGLMRAPIAGGEPVAIAEAASALAQPGAVAVDSTHVYWLTDTAVMRLAKAPLDMK